MGRCAADAAALAADERAGRMLAEAEAIHLEDLPQPILLRAVNAWTQLFGMVSFEIFGQLTGAFTDNTPFFAVATDAMADFVGFPPEK
jgi:hypothetical protein